MNKVLKGCAIVGAVVSIFIVISIVGLISAFVGKEEKPPQITQGEFPFVVEYEMGGETYLIEDTVVCEFDGYDLSALTINKPRKWKKYLKSGKDSCLILSEKNKPSAIKERRHNEWARLRVFYGAPEYYMGDPTYKSLVHKYPGFIYYETYTENGEKRYGWGTELTDDELKKYFKITVKRFEFSKPIKNKFK